MENMMKHGAEMRRTMMGSDKEQENPSRDGGERNPMMEKGMGMMKAMMESGVQDKMGDMMRMLQTLTQSVVQSTEMTTMMPEEIRGSVSALVKLGSMTPTSAFGL